jgi:addiction module RelE/StbE family toxin
VTVTWRKAALNDVARIVRRVAKENPIVARRIARELLLAGESLTVFPHRGRVGRVNGTRELVALRPYIIVYRVKADNDVAVLRVWHSSQDHP